MRLAFLPRVFNSIDNIDLRIAIADLRFIVPEIEADGVKYLIVSVLFDLKKEVVMSDLPNETGM